MIVKSNPLPLKILKAFMTYKSTWGVIGSTAWGRI